MESKIQELKDEIKCMKLQPEMTGEILKQTSLKKSSASFIVPETNSNQVFLFFIKKEIK